MLRLYADKLTYAMSVLAGLAATTNQIGNRPIQWRSEGELEHIEQMFREMDMPASLRFLHRLQEATKDGSPYPATLVGERINMLIQAMQAELEGKLFLGVDLALAPYFDVTPLFGKNVEDKFPKASEDIAEAGKCLALERATAAVFHLGRAMESAVQGLAAKLGIPNVEREWGKLLSDIHTKIEALPKGDARNEWSEVHANLYHVKQAWRNDTMHPKQTYTREEALDIFRAIKAFMNQLCALV